MEAFQGRNSACEDNRSARDNADTVKQLDGIVSSVVNNGFFVDVGPLTVFVSVQV